MSILSLWFIWFSMASCEQVIFNDNTTLCVSINKNWNNYNLNSNINCTVSSCPISCNLMIENVMTDIWSCNGSFTWDKNRMELLTITVTNSNFIWANSQKIIRKFYNFWAGNWQSSTSSNYDIHNFLLSTNNSSPSTSQRNNLTIRARNNNNSTLTNFNEKVRFKVYYRSSSSSSWTETTSSTYYTMGSSFTNWYIFSTSDNGIKTLNNFIRFNSNNHDYKVRVYYDNDSSVFNEILFYVGTSSSSYDLNNFLLSTNNSSPSTSQRNNLTIRARNNNNSTLNNFNEKVRFRVYYRSSSSSSWTETTSSTYYTMGSNFTNWYTFSTSDNGVKTLNNFIRFNRNNYDYKVRVYYDNDSSIFNEILFYVWWNTNSTVAWFTTNELEMVQRIYNTRPQLISKLKNEYPSFKTNISWATLSSNLYKNMKDVLDNTSTRKFTNYNKFMTDFQVWYSRTINVIN